MKEIDQKIKHFVYAVRRRLRKQKILEILFLTIGSGFCISFVLSVISLFVLVCYVSQIIIGITAISFLAGIIAGWKKTPSVMEAALLADAKGHKEKISTAYFLKGKEDLFSVLQKKDAIKIVENFQIRKEFPVQISGKKVMAVVGLGILLIGSMFLESPARDLAAEKQRVKKEVQEELAKVEKLEKKIRQNEEIDEQELTEVDKELEEIKKELAEAETDEALKKAKERLTKKMEMAGEQTKSKTLKNLLSAEAKAAKEEMEQQKSELAKEAKEAMNKAENGTKQDKKEAAQKLEELAAQTGDDQLKEAAKEYKASDYSEKAYEAAQHALNSNLQQSDNTDMAQQNATQNNSGASGQQSSNQQGNGQQGSSQQGSSQQGNGQQSSSQQGSNQQGNGSGIGQGEGSGSGIGQGEGSGSGSGQGEGNGSGSGQGEGSGSGIGQGGSGSGAGWNKGSKYGQEGLAKSKEQITIPDAELGNDANLTGKANENSNITKEKSNQSQTWSGNKVSYGEVSGEYKEKAYKKVNGSSYPGQLKEKIKNYFDGLN